MNRRKAAVTRDDSFKRPGAVPFLWEERPGVPKDQDLQEMTICSVSITPSPSSTPSSPNNTKSSKELELNKQTRLKPPPPPQLLRRSLSEARPSIATRYDRFFLRVSIVKKFVKKFSKGLTDKGSMENN